MKISIILTFICAVTAAQFVLPEDEDTSNPDTGGGFLSKLGNASAISTTSVMITSSPGLDRNPKLDALKEAARAAAATLDEKAGPAKAQVLSGVRKMLDRTKDNLRTEYGLHETESLDEEEPEWKPGEEFGGPKRACSKRDCKRQYHMTETVRWFRQALSDVGVSALENPKATVALFIGATVLTASLASGGGLIPAALNAIGFGTRGPIAGTIASLVQKQLGTIGAGSVFAQLQSAAMGGVVLGEIQKMATIGFAGLGAIGATSLIGANTKPLGQTTDFEPAEWRNWEMGSRIEYNSELAKRLERFWGPPTAESCVAYGYREYRAPIWFVPEGQDPIETCLGTPASIKGIGFKTPLGCADEGPKQGVVATWYIQSNETQCMPHWGKFEDDGCMQYGRRRNFARLLGLHRKDDWNGVCESTPARVNGQHYDAPTYCEDK
ncbi:hypothetical protein FRC09_004935, partial [Ceratobasidium sp. 395]